MSVDPNDMLLYLSEVEVAAEDILCDREQMVNLDRKRNGNREALRAIRKEIQSDASPDSKSWTCFGNMFLKMDNQSIEKLLTKDIDIISCEIDNLQDGLKTKVNKLRDLEGKAKPQGFSLQPLSRDEMVVVNQIKKGTSG